MSCELRGGFNHFNVPSVTVSSSAQRGRHRYLTRSARKSEIFSDAAYAIWSGVRHARSNRAALLVATRFQRRRPSVEFDNGSTLTFDAKSNCRPVIVAGEI